MPSTELRSFVIAHGKKPAKKDGHLSLEFSRELYKAAEIANQQDGIGIVISGGKTRKKYPPESELGAHYLQDKTSAPIFKEDNSRTTVENVIFVKALLAKEPIDTLIVVASRRRIFRIKYIYHKLWPELRGKISFVSVPNSYGFYSYLPEYTYLLYTIFDTKEIFLPPRLIKKWFRNS